MADQYKIEAVFSGDTKDLEKSVQGLEDKIEDSTDKMSDMGGTAKTIGKALAGAFAVKQVVDFGKDVVETTARLDAMRAQFDQVFTGAENIKALEQLGTASDELGIHVDRLTDSYNMFGAQTKGAGMDAVESLEATDKATRLAADSAAFFDRSMEESSASLASFMKGNFAAGDAIGVFTNAKQMDIRANEKYGKSWADLSEAERQWLLLDTVEKTYELNGAMGQAARESGEYANVMGNLKATWDAFKTTIGAPLLNEIVIPAMMALIDVILGVTESVQGMIDWFKEHETAATIAAVVIGALTVALIAYNVQQNAVAIGAKLMAAKTVIATGAASAFGAVMAFITSPIFLVVAAIAAVIAIGVLLYKNWDTVKEKAAALGSFLSNKWDDAKNWTSEKWGAIKDGIRNSIEGARDTVKRAIDKIKSFFDFTWELPKLKLPRISVTGKFSLAPPQIPKFGIDWYAQGGIFSSPSVIGVGEAGEEAVLPTHKLDAFLKAAVTRVQNSASTVTNNTVPVNLTLAFGNNSYQAFVEDITSQQNTTVQFDLAYGGTR